MKVDLVYLWCDSHDEKFLKKKEKYLKKFCKKDNIYTCVTIPGCIPVDEQIELAKSVIGDDAKLLKENLEVDIMFFEGEMLGMNLPDKIEMKVVHTEPAVKGNTTSSAMKDATLESGLTVKVPLFIEQDEVILISSKDGKYVSRA